MASSQFNIQTCVCCSPCAHSFDLIKDDLGAPRSTFPHTVFMVSEQRAHCHGRITSCPDTYLLTASSFTGFRHASSHSQAELCGIPEAGQAGPGEERRWEMASTFVWSAVKWGMQ